MASRLAEKRMHQVAESLVCPLCLCTPGKSRRHFITHVAKHMEGIALAALPRTNTFDLESDNEASTSEDDSNNSSFENFKGANYNCICGSIGHAQDKDDIINQITCIACGTLQHIECYYGYRPGRWRPRSLRNHFCVNCVMRWLKSKLIPAQRYANDDGQQIGQNDANNPNMNTSIEEPGLNTSDYVEIIKIYRRDFRSPASPLRADTGSLQEEHKKMTSSQLEELIMAAKNKDLEKISSFLQEFDNEILDLYSPVVEAAAVLSPSASTTNAVCASNIHSLSESETGYTGSPKFVEDEDASIIPSYTSWNQDNLDRNWETSFNLPLAPSPKPELDLQDRLTPESSNVVLRYSDNTGYKDDYPIIDSHTTLYEGGRQPRVHSVDLVARAPIDRFCHIGKLNGQVYRRDDYRKDSTNSWEETRHPRPFVFFIGGGSFLIDAQTADSLYRYARRSCRPNSTVVTDTIGSSKTSELKLVSFLFSIRSVAVDEKITFGWDFELPCGRTSGLDSYLSGSLESPYLVPSLPTPRDYEIACSLVKRARKDHGGCACGHGSNCRLALFLREHEE